ncbi:hypothetical protein M406DRAFT_327981 [Cryphonectria parasitica EP155]|uniref:C3H1-type domain-containing protein n=1 Tax=Cryphonectria parasitica (strain ATCC 38755 / EP155) TaxID=660469 RepID=A0A9P5CR94_CRYP1|nr:uncharacterized protein M406DRAFT_327981 [Cryphonectria parasitica EP155]KAF3766865.1 hypothetical protein M406DRAFT_327981 [Cryphonectria parasitica EP155]
MADNHLDPQAFKACYAQFSRADSDRDILFNQLLNGYEALLNENTKVIQELKDVKEKRFLWQSQARSFKSELALTESTTDFRPFVVMIMNGDGAHFKDDFFRQGETGGESAAKELKNQIRSHLRVKYSDINIDDWNIMVYLYADMDGLAKVFTSRRVISSASEMQKFCSAFSRANSLFSFVDVGPGQAKTDHKCRKMLDFMLHISSCQHVFFGPCRDVYGYLTLLREYKQDLSREKLILVSAGTAPPDFTGLNFKFASFSSVFSSEPLDNARDARSPRLDIGIEPFPPPLAPPPGLATIESVNECSDINGGSSTALTPASPATSFVGNVSVSLSQTPTWAVVSKLSNGPVIDLYSKKESTPKLRYMLLNASNQRVDERLPAFDHAGMRSIDARTRALGRNFCNPYHLGFGCGRGDACHHHHDVSPKLTPAEKLALRHKSRQIRCPGGQFCARPGCLNGHHCKHSYDKEGQCLWGSKCFFKDTHGIDVCLRTALAKTSPFTRGLAPVECCDSAG